MAYTSGQRLRASELNSWLPIRAQKATAEDRTSTIVLANDNALLLPLLANYEYEYEFFLCITSAANAAGDIRINFTWPTAAVNSYGADGLDLALASGSTGSLTAGAVTPLDGTSPGSSDLLYGASTSITLLRIPGLITMSTTAGNLQLQWAQNASNASKTTIREGSYAIARRVA